MRCCELWCVRILACDLQFDAKFSTSVTPISGSPPNEMNNCQPNPKKWLHPSVCLVRSRWGPFCQLLCVVLDPGGLNKKKKTKWPWNWSPELAFGANRAECRTRPVAAPPGANRCQVRPKSNNHFINLKPERPKLHDN